MRAPHNDGDGDGDEEEEVKRAEIQVSVPRGSAGEYQADEQAGVVRLRWGLSGR